MRPQHLGTDLLGGEQVEFVGCGAHAPQGGFGAPGEADGGLNDVPLSLQVRHKNGRVGGHVPGAINNLLGEEKGVGRSNFARARAIHWVPRSVCAGSKGWVVGIVQKHVHGCVRRGAAGRGVRAACARDAAPLGRRYLAPQLTRLPPPLVGLGGAEGKQQGEQSKQNVVRVRGNAPILATGVAPNIRIEAWPIREPEVCNRHERGKQVDQPPDARRSVLAHREQCFQPLLGVLQVGRRLGDALPHLGAALIDAGGLAACHGHPGDPGIGARAQHERRRRVRAGPGLTRQRQRHICVANAIRFLTGHAHL
eukprot:scaffold19247_cov135-Isochrysis_galbana.AAC.5